MSQAKVFRYKFEFSPSGTKISIQGKSRRAGYHILSQVRVEGDLRNDPAKARKLAAAISSVESSLLSNSS